MNHTTYGVLALILMFGLSAAPAQAQLLDATTGIQLDVQTGLKDLGVEVTTESNASTSIDTESGTSTSAALSGEAGVVTGFSITRAKLTDGTTYSVTEADQVQTSASLESYAGSSVRDDERLESAELENNALSVKYRTDANFLWVIPASMTVTASVDADGTASVRYPWYSFLMSSYESRAELEARLTKEQNSIKDEIAEVQAEGTPRQWALMLERLRMSLYANSSAEARA